MDTFVDAIAEKIGKPIALMPTAAQLNGICGALIVTDRSAYIFYPGATSAVHQQHVLFHEIGHLLCPEHFSIDAAAALAPTLSPELIQRVLGRTDYTSRQEQEAELVATLIAQRARDARGRSSWSSRGPVGGMFDLPLPPDAA